MQVQLTGVPVYLDYCSRGHFVIKFCNSTDYYSANILRQFAISVLTVCSSVDLSLVLALSCLY